MTAAVEESTDSAGTIEEPKEVDVTELRTSKSLPHDAVEAAALEAQAAEEKKSSDHVRLPLQSARAVPGKSPCDRESEKHHFLIKKLP